MPLTNIKAKAKKAYKSAVEKKEKFIDSLKNANLDTDLNNGDNQEELNKLIENVEFWETILNLIEYHRLTYVPEINKFHRIDSKLLELALDTINISLSNVNIPIQLELLDFLPEYSLTPAVQLCLNNKIKGIEFASIIYSNNVFELLQKEFKKFDINILYHPFVPIIWLDNVYIDYYSGKITKDKIKELKEQNQDINKMEKENENK
jgi:hypothetical protein